MLAPKTESNAGLGLAWIFPTLSLLIAYQQLSLSRERLALEKASKEEPKS